jgi:hypothetical protein
MVVTDVVITGVYQVGRVGQLDVAEAATSI